mgnify:CR=1 FL=1
MLQGLYMILILYDILPSGYWKNKLNWIDCIYSFNIRLLLFNIDLHKLRSQLDILWLSELSSSRLADPEYRLIQDLFQNYSSEVRPALNKTNEAVLVEFDLAYSQLVSLVREQNPHLCKSVLERDAVGETADCHTAGSAGFDPQPCQRLNWICAVSLCEIYVD